MRIENIKKSLIIINIILMALIFSNCSDEESGKEIYLLNTQWDQINMYAKYCPENDRAGCWSTAMAQILFFHKIKPIGKVDYETTSGYKINEDLDSYEFDWDLFVEKLDDRTSEDSIDQVAKYIYYSALVLEKDFNTGNYNTVKNEFKNGADFLNVDNAIRSLESHFNCKVEDYHYSKEGLETYANDIEKLIKREIDSKRPIMFYFQSKNQGHAAVIDGYSYFNNKFIVHINQGAGGCANKWYDFSKSITNQLDDMNHRVLITIKPSESNNTNTTENPQENNHLLETQWDIGGNYSKFYPKKLTDYKPVGYWSTALAQILAYHKYQPTGEVNYESSSGVKIKENLESYKFNWDLFVERLDDIASEQSIDQVAKFNYYVEVVLENDFGLDGYNTIIEIRSNTDVNNAIKNLNKHYNCNAKAYSYMEEEIKSSKDAIIRLIKKEIDNKRPILFYFKPYSGDGCCIVIDGYLEESNGLFVHTNFGRDGFNNQWYEIEPLLDVSYLILITIEENMSRL